MGRCTGAPAGAVDALAVGDALRVLAVRGARQRLAAVGPREARVAEALGPVADAAAAALARPLAARAGQGVGAVVARVARDARARAVDADALGQG